MVSSAAAGLARFPEGYCVAVYRGVTYGVTKTTSLGGRSSKLYGEELGGTDFVSLNWYLTSRGEALKPCEMPAAKVLDFLRGAEPASPS